MFPLQKLRTEFRSLYGFDPFFPYPLNEEKTEFAFLMPRKIYESKEHLDIVGFLTQFIATMNWHAEYITWFESKSYSLEHRNCILGPHVTFQVVSHACHIPYNVILEIPHTWNILEVSCDDVKSCDSVQTFLYDATFPTNYQTTLAS